YKIQKYYDEHLDDYKVDDQIKLRMIFIKKVPPVVEAAVPPAGQSPTAGEGPSAATNATDSVATNAAETAAATTPSVDPRRKLGEEIVAKLDEGASFESMA